MDYIRCREMHKNQFLAIAFSSVFHKMRSLKIDSAAILAIFSEKSLLFPENCVILKELLMDK